MHANWSVFRCDCLSIETIELTPAYCSMDKQTSRNGRRRGDIFSFRQRDTPLLLYIFRSSMRLFALLNWLFIKDEYEYTSVGRYTSKFSRSVREWQRIFNYFQQTSNGTQKGGIETSFITSSIFFKEKIISSRLRNFFSKLAVSK